MSQDVRDLKYLEHRDVIGLNFIRTGGPYVFRRHFRQGLRSHVLEVLNASDLARETGGEAVDGVIHFPRARPVRMFRIFRTRLESLEAALGEISRVKLVERFLAPDFMACSNEMVVDYFGPEGRDLLLCGLQAYVCGAVVDPWNILDGTDFLKLLYDGLPLRLAHPPMHRDHWLAKVYRNGCRFIACLKQMVVEAHHVPDLAGVGNILVTPGGRFKLVDINNISRVHFDRRITLDDRGYPVCDKSIEALALLEAKVTGRAIDSSDPVYKAFLDPIRQQEVEATERQFVKTAAAGAGTRRRPDQDRR